MTTTAEPIRVTAPPTATYRRRRALWIPGDRPGELADTREGTLRVVQEKAKRSRDADDVDEYGVQPDTDPLEDGEVAAFILRNDTPPAAEGEVRDEFYRVGLRRSGGVTCTCKAARTRAPSCKHRDTVLELALAGVFSGGFRQ